MAFLSYVRSDDDHDGGQVTSLRELLEGEVKMQTGMAFPIFQDRNEILWGQRWKDRIEDSIFAATFLIPIVTPSYFRSQMCRKEFETFMLRERTLGVNSLILPIYYVTAKELHSEFPEGADIIADIIRSRNWADWRHNRFKSLKSAEVRQEISKLATTIDAAISELNAVKETSDRKATAEEPPRPVEQVESSRTGLRSGGDSIAVEAVRVDGKVDADRYRVMSSKRGYYVYTKEFDEVILAKSLVEQTSFQSHQDTLLATVKRLKFGNLGTVESEANRLKGLKNIGAHSVCLMIDNSGSLRGPSIQNISAWLAIAAEILEWTGVRSEIIGFTTRAWKGGSSREAWLADGRPDRPGRLNDLRYIVYKSFDTSYEESIPNISVMLRDGLLKENIDGEALLWGYERVIGEVGRQRHLVMISDGAPVDDSTLSANPPDLLDKHLLQSADWVRSQRKVSLSGIGIGHDVSRYYAENSSVVGKKGDSTRSVQTAKVKKSTAVNVGVELISAIMRTFSDSAS